MSLSILEAASSGCVVVSTRCGNTHVFLREEHNGFFVNRTVESIEEKIGVLSSDTDRLKKMSKAMREEMVLNWDWDQRSIAWMRFIKNHL